MGNGGSTYGGGDAGSGYIRGVNPDQIDAGGDADVQQSGGWCRAERHRIVDLIADDGVIGAWADRPALAEASTPVGENADRSAPGRRRTPASSWGHGSP